MPATSCAATACASSAAASAPTTAAGTRPGEVFGACAGAALYRRAAVLDAGGFHDPTSPTWRTWTSRCGCAWPAGPAATSPWWRSMPPRARRARCRAARPFWPRATRSCCGAVLAGAVAGLVPYRQLGWAWHALRERRLRAHLRALSAAVPMLPAALRQRRALRAAAVVPIRAAIPRGRGAARGR